MRDRATDLLAEEDDLAKALASTWARDPDKPFPRLHAEPDAAARRASAAFWTIDSTPESPDTPVVQASGWGPVGGDGSGLTQRLTELIAQGYTITVAADGAGSAGRLREILLEHGLDFPVGQHAVTGGEGRTRQRGRSSSPRSTAAARSRTPSWRSSPRATSPAAGAPTARRARASARAPPPSRTSSPATTSCTTSTASATTRAWSSARSAGSSATTCSSPTRAATSCTCRPTRSTRCASTSAARRPASTASAAATSPSRRAGSARRCARSPRSSSCSTRSASTPTGHAFGSDTPWQHEMEEAFPYVETPDQRKAIDDIKADMERAVPDGPPGVRRRRVRQDRGRDPRRVQGDPGRQAGRRARARPRCSRASTATRSPTASPATRSASRCCRASSPPREAKKVLEGCGTARSTA